MDATAFDLLNEINGKLNRLLASGSVARTNVEPLRVSLAEVAQMLRVSTREVNTLAARGLLVKLPKRPGAAKNARTYFDPENVAALAKSEDDAREWVARRKFVPKAKRKELVR